MNYLVHPMHILTKANSVKGFHDILPQVPFGLLADVAEEVAQQWTDDWPEGQGFGTSDGTYLLQDVIDQVIDKVGCDFRTTFLKGYLTVVPK